MSADNWTICPKCDAKALELVLAARAAYEEAYGKVTREEYVRLGKEVKKVEAAYEHRETTFREDYEIGVYGDEFCVSYSGVCTECKYEYSFSHKEVLK